MPPVNRPFLVCQSGDAIVRPEHGRQDVEFFQAEAIGDDRPRDGRQDPMTSRLDRRTNSLTLQPHLVSAREAFGHLPWQGVGDIARDLHLTVEELAGALGVEPRELDAMYDVDDSTPSLSEEVVNRIVALADLHAHLMQTFRSSEAIPLWMRTDSRYLGGRTPADVLRDGSIGRVDAALEALDYGAFV
jgi:hypothetical protein